MECNKDEAVRAIQIAESRMQRGEFVEALKYATKAKQLYADIENIAKILTVCQVHNAAQIKLSDSNMNWYEILQTEGLADEAIIKKQYRKLALLLHPDKNKFAGAEAAFKLIGEANRVLSDPATRSLYDNKFRASVKAAAPKTSHHLSKRNVFAAKQDGNMTNYQKNSYSNSTSFNQQSGPTTFWTSCQHCNTKYQYYTLILNATLSCQNCRKRFIARAVHFVSEGVFPGYTSVNVQKENRTDGHPKPASERNGGRPLGGEHTGTSVRSNRIPMKKCATEVGGHFMDAKSKDVPPSKGMESQSSKNFGSKRVRQSAPDSSFKAGNGNDMKDVNFQENGVDPSKLGARKSSRQKQHVSYVETSEDDDFEIYSKKPRQNGSINAAEATAASGGLSNNNAPEETFSRNQSKVEQSRVEGEKVSESDPDLGTSKENNFPPLNSNVRSGPEVILCPDADFNDFDKGKAEVCFAVNQLWAIYDPTDSMPRFYALVKKVASPFKLQITWLEPDPDNEDEIGWHNADLPIACGKFTLGNSQKIADLSMFSHQIQCMKGSAKGSYLVYPNKGETWAIFRDWNIKWSSNPENYLECDFEYVEILSDFAENIGIKIAFLDKVKGFVSLFQKIEKNGVDIFYVPPNELYRFSHRIPSYTMTGNEKEGVPRGSFELDPAALPTNIFEVGDSGNEKMMNGMSNPGVEQVMGKVNMHGSNDAEKHSSVRQRSSRGH